MGTEVKMQVFWGEHKHFFLNEALRAGRRAVKLVELLPDFNQMIAAVDTSEFSLGTVIYKPFNTFQWNSTTPPGPKECQLSHFMAEMPKCEAFKGRVEHKLCELGVITSSPSRRFSQGTHFSHSTHTQCPNTRSLGVALPGTVRQKMSVGCSRNVTCLHAPVVDALATCVHKKLSNPVFLQHWGLSVTQAHWINTFL